METYKTYPEFFKWYIGQLDDQVPQWQVYAKMPSSTGGYRRIHREMPRLERSQVKELNKVIREQVKFPKKIKLSYHAQADTWSAGWRSRTGNYTINYPTLIYYWMSYPSLIQTALLHELGHIFNGDSQVRNRSGHASCTNICMDVRCNAPLDRETLMQINDCLFHFEIKRPQGVYVPEQFYPQVGLSILPQGWSFEQTHNAYHQKDYDDEEPEPQQAPPWVPMIGDHVLLTEGANKGKIGRIINIPEMVMNKKNTECVEFYKEVMKDVGSCKGGGCGLKYNENLDYTAIQRCDYEIESVNELDEKIYSKKMKPSEMDELDPQELREMISKPPIVIYGIYKRIDFVKVDAINEPPPPPECPCKDEKGNLTGASSTECCPKPPPPPRPPPPQIGDLVMVKGGKYGKVIGITGEDEDEDYEVEEVSVDIVNATLGTNLK